MFQEISLKAPGEKKLWSDLLRSNYFEIVEQIDESIKYPMGFKVFFPYRSSRQRFSVKKVLVKKAFLSPATLLKKRLWHRCFPVNFAKFLRTPFIIEHL